MLNMDTKKEINNQSINQSINQCWMVWRKSKKIGRGNGKQKKCGHCKWIEKHSPRSQVLGLLKPIYEEVLLNDFKPYETTDKTKKIEKEYQK